MNRVERSGAATCKTALRIALNAVVCDAPKIAIGHKPPNRAYAFLLMS